ncbi:YciI family protein [Sciscionella marina]|uniref:YciI family protein n=1 Tax=Sciscionella marina TaxID=508770 RepID=UPI000367A79A|nr:YciI family protein [Sciscionella marina]
MAFVLTLEFGADERRLAARPAHRERLTRLHADGVLLMAGPWRDGSGALLVFDTDESGIEAELAADPYYRTPGVTVREIREWSPLPGLRPG